MANDVNPFFAKYVQTNFGNFLVYAAANLGFLVVGSSSSSARSSNYMV